MVKSFETSKVDQIRQAGEIDWEIVEYWKTVDGLKSKNLDIFRKIIQNGGKSEARNHER